MSFLRTNSGISNMRHFHDAELVLFTEGGNRSFSVAEVEEGQFNEISIDIKFWQGIFEVNGFNKKIKFKPIGSKTSSAAMTKKILNNEIKNAAIAKDRDLDDFLNGIADSPYILYTKGYSWENDVYVKDITLQQIKDFATSSQIAKEEIDIIEKAYKDFMKVSKNIAKLEIIFRSNGIKFVSDLNGEQFFNSKKGISINKSELYRVLEAKKPSLGRPLQKNINWLKVCPQMNIYGKLVEAFSITILTYICKNFYNYGAMPKTMLQPLMINNFIHFMRFNGDTYYQNVVARLSAAIP